MIVNTLNGIWRDFVNLLLLPQRVADIKKILIDPPDERNFFMHDYNKIRAGMDSIRHHHKMECPCRYAPDLPCFCQGKNQAEGLYAEGQQPMPAVPGKLPYDAPTQTPIESPEEVPGPKSETNTPEEKN